MPLFSRFGDQCSWLARVYCADACLVFTKAAWANGFHVIVLLVKIMICQLGGMFEIENKMVVVIITSSLIVIIPNCVCKSLYMHLLGHLLLHLSHTPAYLSHPVQNHLFQLNDIVIKLSVSWWIVVTLINIYLAMYWTYIDWSSSVKKPYSFSYL